MTPHEYNRQLREYFYVIESVKKALALAHRPEVQFSLMIRLLTLEQQYFKLRQTNPSANDDYLDTSWLRWQIWWFSIRAWWSARPWKSTK